MEDNSNATNASSFEDAAKVISYALLLLIGLIYLFCLGYLEALKVPEYPGVFTAIVFFLGSVAEQIYSSANTTSVVLMCVICIFSNLLIKYVIPNKLIEKIKVRLPATKDLEKNLERAHTTNTTLHQRLASAKDIEKPELEKLIAESDEIIADIEKLILETRKIELNITKTGVQLLGSFVIPATIYLFYLSPISAFVLLPFILSMILASMVARNINYKNVYPVNLGIITVAIILFIWTCSGTYTMGRSILTLPNLRYSNKFPSAYSSEKDERYLKFIWIEGQNTYWVFCDDQDPRLIGKRDETVFFSRYINKSMFDLLCRR